MPWGSVTCGQSISLTVPVPEVANTAGHIRQAAVRSRPEFRGSNPEQHLLTQ